MIRTFVFCAAAFALFLFGTASDAQAQCTRLGQELCQNGQVYRCEKTGSELTPIFQNRRCTVSAPSLVGVWRGTGHQSPAPPADADWSIAMTITASGGSIDYPSLGCGGSLTQLSRDATSAQFRESITYGQKKCIDGGSITVRLVNGQLAWSWFGQAQGKQIGAIAVLTR